MRAPPPPVWLPWGLLAGLALLGTVQGVKATSLIAKYKGRFSTDPTTTTTTTTTKIPDNDELAVSLHESEILAQVLALADSNSTSDGNSTSTKSPLTGIPQIDYLLDPNLPRELNGFNLTDYPFYDRLPEGLDFKCDGLHDGFYASVLHRCQVYHHCLFGTRYDFLCANYTAFDQKTFICHFASEVDCVNSPKYFKRNEALYKAATTTPAPTTAPPVRRKVVAAVADPPTGAAGRRRRPPARSRRPVYDDTYDDDYYDDDYYDDDADAPATGGRRGGGGKSKTRPTSDSGSDASGTGETVKSRPAASVFERPRVPPKIRRPVPSSEREKYDYRSPSGPGDDSRSTTTKATTAPPASSTSKPTTSTAAAHSGEEYDDSMEYNHRSRNKEYYPPTGGEERDFVRRPPATGAGRPLRRNRGPARRRPPPPDDFYDDYEEEPPPPPRRRKPYRQRRPYRASASREVFRGGYYDDYDDRGVYARPKYKHEDDYDAPPPRRGYKRPARYESEYDDDEYYDDEEEEETPVYSRKKSQPQVVSRQSSTISPRSRESDRRMTADERSSQRRAESTTTKKPPIAKHEDYEITRAPFKPSTSRSTTTTTTTTTPPPPPPPPPPPISTRYNNFFRPSAPASPVDVELKPSRNTEIRPSEALVPIGAVRVNEYDPQGLLNKYNHRQTTPEPRVTSYRPSGPEGVNLYRNSDLKSSSRPDPKQTFQPEIARNHYNRQPVMEPPSQHSTLQWSNRNNYTPEEKNRAYENVVPPDDELEDEEEYDVTINDALHPTLHPARRNVQGVAVAGAAPRQTQESAEELAPTNYGRLRRIQRVQRKPVENLSGY